jgi:hypothetical protein
MSAFALDPIYSSLARTPEFRALGGIDHLPPGTRDRSWNEQDAPTIQYHDVRRIKHEALETAYRQFLGAEWRYTTSRTRSAEGTGVGPAGLSLGGARAGRLSLLRERASQRGAVRRLPHRSPRVPTATGPSSQVPAPNAHLPR